MHNMDSFVSVILMLVFPVCRDDENKIMYFCLSDDNTLAIIIIHMDVSCHIPFLPGTSLEPAVIPTAQASSFTLQYFPYYV